MGSVQIVTTILAAAITAVAVWLAVRAVRQMMAVIRLGQPDPGAVRRQGHPHQDHAGRDRSATPGCSSGAWSAPRTGS